MGRKEENGMIERIDDGYSKGKVSRIQGKGEVC